MFCSGCGQAMQAFEQVCPKCGRPVPPMPLSRPAFYSRVQRHIQTVGILWLVWAAWSVIGWLIALPFVAGVFGGWGWGGDGGERLFTFWPRVSVSAHDVATRLYYGDCLWTGVSGCDHRYRSAAPCSMGADTGDCDCLP